MILILPRMLLWDVWVLPYIKRQIFRYYRTKTVYHHHDIGSSETLWKQVYYKGCLIIGGAICFSLFPMDTGGILMMVTMGLFFFPCFFMAGRRHDQKIHLFPAYIEITSEKGEVLCVPFPDIYRISFFRYIQSRYMEFYPSVTIEGKGTSSITDLPLKPQDYLWLRRYCICHQLPVQDIYAEQLKLPDYIFCGTKEAPIGDYRDDTKPFRY